MQLVRAVIAFQAQNLARCDAQGACQEYLATSAAAYACASTLNGHTCSHVRPEGPSGALPRLRAQDASFLCSSELPLTAWRTSPHASSCMSQVPVEALIEYWTNLPEEHRTALFQLRDEDFAAELDAHLKYQLRICKDCRGNVTRAFRCALLAYRA